jgi:hypothetical protein
MNRAPTQQISILRSLRLQSQQCAQVSDYGKAEELLLEAYDYAKQLFGPDHGEVGLILLALVTVCEAQGKAELAEAYWAETEKIAQVYLHASR